MLGCSLVVILVTTEQDVEQAGWTRCSCDFLNYWLF